MLLFTYVVVELSICSEMMDGIAVQPGTTGFVVSDVPPETPVPCKHFVSRLVIYG